MSVVQKPERFISISSAKVSIQQNAINLDSLKKYNDSNIVDKVLSKYPKLQLLYL
jgi:hypothetical protein